MKTLKNNVILLLILVIGIGANAQTKKDKKPTKEAYVKIRMDAKRYTFLANYVLPQRGGGRQLTSEYDLRVTPDSVISFLPYFGRAYFDVPYGGGDGGIKFTSTKFTYEAKEKKKGGWEISIRP
jgi:glutamate dehydrogenase/leucine dehydrogenase